jgi:chromosome segregation ATPase
VLHNAIEKISAQKKEFLKLHGTYQTLKQSLDQAMQQSIRSQQEIDQLKKHIAELQTHLVEDYTDRLQTLQDQKNHLQQQKTNFDQQDFQQFDQLITCYPDVYEKPDKWTFADAYHCLNAFRSYGTTLKERYDRLEQERQHLQKRLDEFSTNLNQYEFSDGTQAWKLLEVEAQKLIKEYRDRLAMIIQQRNFDINQIDDIVHQRQQLAIKKQILCEHLDQASVFHCEKIE